MASLAFFFLVTFFSLCCSFLPQRYYPTQFGGHQNSRFSLSESSSEVLLPDDPRIVPIELSDELKTSFMSYAMSTILSRALPDARDGLKPVHRRVLYAMQVLNLTPDSSYRKCARVVGEVLGKFHPHGDQSVYDALVRMAQDFVMRHPLVLGHGNFGSIDNDPPAAMRYTEAKLSSAAYDILLSDIKEDTVDFVPNFDGNEIEPLVLPARAPMLLLNGASGIAVGMSTNIPPHNLGELCDAIVAIVNNPDLTDDELFKIIPAPDFPTGGLIIGHSGAQKMYSTGHGSIVMRAKCHIEQIAGATSAKGGVKARNAIVVTELPYMTNKAALLEKIAELVNDKKLEGISDLRDESDREGVRVVIELKRDALPALVQNNLFKKTALQASFSGNMLALVDDGRQPKRVTLRESLDIFVSYRFQTLRRRANHQLMRLRARAHIVEGLLIAISRLDDLITLVRTSKDQTEARKKLKSEAFGLSTEQADAILGLRLGRLTALESKQLKEEQKDLKRNIADLEKFMADDKRVYDLLKEETMALKKAHALPRRSQLWADEADFSTEDLVANARSVIIITHSGYIKRLPIEEFEAQSRGGKGKAGTKLSTEDDSVMHSFYCNDHDSILFATDKGIAYSVKAYQVPLASRTAKGVPLPQVLPISANEQVTSVIPIDHFGEDEHLVLLTTRGYVKRTPLKAFEYISARGLIIIGLGENDKLQWARRCRPSDQILVATKDGFAARFDVNEVTITGRTSRGVRALKLRDGDEIADLDVLRGSGGATQLIHSQQIGVDATVVDENSFVLLVTEKGYGKRTPIEEFRLCSRGAKGVTAMKFKPKAGGGGRTSRIEGRDPGESDSVRCMRVCRSGDEIVLTTGKGTISRQRVDDLSIQSRSATGVVLQKLAKDDKVATVDIVPPPLDNVVT